jgi:hypothetical protein
LPGTSLEIRFHFQSPLESPASIRATPIRLRFDPEEELRIILFQKKRTINRGDSRPSEYAPSTQEQEHGDYEVRHEPRHHPIPVGDIGGKF